MRGYAQVAAILGLEAAAIFLLHKIGSNTEFQVDWNNFSHWLSTAELQTLIAASARLVGLVIAYYLFISTALYTLATLLRFKPALSVLKFFTVPAVRRSLDKALAATALTASLVGGPATFAAAAETPPYFPDPITQTNSPTGGTTTTTTPPATTPSDDDNQDNQTINELFPQQGSTTTTTPKPSTTSTTTQVTIPGLGETTVTTTPAETPTPTPTPAPAPQVQGEQVYKVVPGDNLWSISKQHLANVRGVDPSTLSDHDIAKYWLQVIEVNKPNLRSGNPNLIYPDEQITLPEIPAGS